MATSPAPNPSTGVSITGNNDNIPNQVQGVVYNNIEIPQSHESAKHNNGPSGGNQVNNLSCNIIFIESSQKLGTNFEKIFEGNNFKMK